MGLTFNVNADAASKIGKGDIVLSEGTAKENIFQKAVRDYKMEARTDNESLAIITKLVGIFESRGPGDPQYESLEHIRLMMINGRNVNKEKAILDQRKKLKSEGKIY